MNRAAYQKLVDENLEWLSKQPHSLEKLHIEIIVADSPDRIYGNTRTADNEWVSVNDKLPEESIYPILAGRSEKYGVPMCMEAQYINEEFISLVSGKIVDVTHWMKLPEAPKQGAEIDLGDMAKATLDKFKGV